jgi:hypothetical protein
MTTAKASGQQVDKDAAATASGQVEKGEWWARVGSRLSKVFEVSPQGLNWARGVLFLDVVLVPLVVLTAIGQEPYLLSAVFGALVALAIDPGGGYGRRASEIAIHALIGALVTALGFAIATLDWGWVVLAAFVVTFAAGLAVKFGLHRFAGAMLLNLWFLVTLALATSLSGAHQSSHTWGQVLAWVGGSALWIAVTFIGWLARGRKDRPPTVPEIPGDTSSRKLTPPLIMFALIRALAIAGAVAIAFGADLQHAAWLPIATLVAMKPDLDSSRLVAEQRLAGALIGAAVAALLLLIPANEHGLRLITIEHTLFVVALVLLLHGAAMRFWNYAFYCGAIAAGALLAIDLPHPSNYSALGDRVLYTLGGVGIGVLVMLLADLLGKRRTKAQPQPT